VNVSDELVELARNHEKRKNRIEKSLIDNGGLEPLVIGITNYAVLQRRSERNTTEGSIHGNANNAPKMPMG
jgi:hypothetical protein